MTDLIKPDVDLLAELRGLIEQARQHVAQTANSTLTMLHWHMGQRIHREILNQQRASYGEEILPTLSAKLEPEYGKGFSVRNLARMIKFAEAFQDEQIVATLSRQLSWSHFVEILPLKKPLEQEFYAEMCRIERWSVRTLRERIGSDAADSSEPDAPANRWAALFGDEGQYAVCLTRNCSGRMAGEAHGWRVYDSH